MNSSSEFFFSILVAHLLINRLSFDFSRIVWDANFHLFASPHRHASITLMLLRCATFHNPGAQHHLSLMLLEAAEPNELVRAARGLRHAADAGFALAQCFGVRPEGQGKRPGAGKCL